MQMHDQRMKPPERRGQSNRMPMPRRMAIGVAIDQQSQQVQERSSLGRTGRHRPSLLVEEQEGLGLEDDGLAHLCDNAIAHAVPYAGEHHEGHVVAARKGALRKGRGRGVTAVSCDIASRGWEAAARACEVLQPSAASGS